MVEPTASESRHQINGNLSLYHLRNGCMKTIRTTDSQRKQQPPTTKVYGDEAADSREDIDSLRFPESNFHTTIIKGSKAVAGATDAIYSSAKQAAFLANYNLSTDMRLSGDRPPASHRTGFGRVNH